MRRRKRRKSPQLFSIYGWASGPFSKKNKKGGEKGRSVPSNCQKVRRLRSYRKRVASLLSRNKKLFLFFWILFWKGERERKLVLKLGENYFNFKRRRTTSKRKGPQCCDVFLNSRQVSSVRFLHRNAFSFLKNTETKEKRKFVRHLTSTIKFDLFFLFLFSRFVCVCVCTRAVTSCQPVGPPPSKPSSHPENV